MKSIKGIALIIATSATLQAATETLSVDGKTQVAEAPLWQLYAPVAESNPAAMPLLLPFSLSRVAASGSIEEMDHPEVVQEGTGHLLGNIDASSLMKLSEATTVWGHATFTAGKRRGARWNNSADYRLVGPFVIGDSVGGDLSTRSYDFGGGYAGTKGGWNWGAEASYNATIEHRSRDPRDKIIVSDLRVAIGGARAIGGTYTIGLSARGRVYNQESDVDFYNPVNDIRLYALTGLGSYNPRFSGTATEATAYSGLGAGASLQLVPRPGEAAWRAEASFDYLRVKQILRGFNNLDLTSAANYSLTIRLGRDFRFGNHSAGFLVKATAHRRIGVENIFGTSVGNNYTRIGSAQRYHADRAAATLSVPVEIGISAATQLDIIATATAGYTREFYRDPRRDLSTISVAPALEARLRIALATRWALRVGASGSAYLPKERERLLTLLDITSDLGATVVNNFDILCARSTTFGGSVAADWTLPSGSQRLSLCLRGSATGIKGHGDRLNASASLSLSF